MIHAGKAMNAEFLTPLNLQDIDGERFTLLTPLVYRANDGRIWSVDTGFVTDFASIPRPLWWRYPKSGTWNRAAVLHDWLYAINGVTRSGADLLFREALQACGVNRWTRNVFYVAVRVGGAGAWRKYRAVAASAVSVDSRPAEDA